MWFECEQPFLSGERCVTSRKTAAKETIFLALNTVIYSTYLFQNALEIMLIPILIVAKATI